MPLQYGVSQAPYQCPKSEELESGPGFPLPLPQPCMGGMTPHLLPAGPCSPLSTLAPGLGLEMHGHSPSFS